MARVYPVSVEDFKAAVLEHASPKTHTLYVSDDGSKTTIVLYPKVTSRHRPYIEYSTNLEEEARQLLDWLQKRGWKRPINAVVVKAET